MEAVALTLKQQENMSKPIIKMALMLLDNIRQQLINGECDEADIQDAMTKFHPEKNQQASNVPGNLSHQRATD